MTPRDTENLIVLGLLVWLLWRRTHSEVLIDYGGGFQPPIMEPTTPATPATPSGEPPVMNEIGVWIDPGSGYWWNSESQTWNEPIYAAPGPQPEYGGGNSSLPFAPL